MSLISRFFCWLFGIHSESYSVVDYFKGEEASERDDPLADSKPPEEVAKLDVRPCHVVPFRKPPEKPAEKSV